MTSRRGASVARPSAERADVPVESSAPVPTGHALAARVRRRGARRQRRLAPAVRRRCLHRSRACCPAFRRRGVGTQLLHALADQALACGRRGRRRAARGSRSAAFASAVRLDRAEHELEQVYAIRGDEPSPTFPTARLIAPRRAVPTCGRGWPELVEAALADFAVDRPIAITERGVAGRAEPSDEWAPSSRSRATRPSAMAGLLDARGRPGACRALAHRVRRDLRRRGIARALKRAQPALGGATAG